MDHDLHKGRDCGSFSAESPAPQSSVWHPTGVNKYLLNELINKYTCMFSVYLILKTILIGVLHFQQTILIGVGSLNLCIKKDFSVGFYFLKEYKRQNNLLKHAT